MKRTKVVCTLGPASRSPETVAEMIEAGMDVARLNFSHGGREEHGRALETVRSGWEKFLGELGHRRSMLASQLAMAEVRSVEGRTVVAAFGTSGHAALQVLQKPTNLSLISEALCRHFESDLNLHLTQIEDAQPTARRKRPGRRRVDPTQLLAKSARLRELVEKVDGEIIGVRRAAD